MQFESVLQMYLAIPNQINDTIDRYVEKLGHPVPVKKVVIESGTVTFIGDTHGALDVTSYALAVSVNSRMVCFVGDLVDRGKNQLLNLLFPVECAIFSTRIVIVRGNHESSLTNEYYGFMDELKEFGLLESVYPHILRLYGRLPYALFINGQLIAVHGGIPQGATEIGSWEKLPMDDLEPANQDAFQILWNDPREYVDGFLPGTRGEGTYLFGPDAFNDFARKNGIKLMVRAHEVKKNGYEYMFGDMLVSIFSSRYHKGKAAILDVQVDGGLGKESQKIGIVPDEVEGSIEWPLKRA